ncbi:MAG: glycosyltransferase [Gammaproteobacteria bacterium]|nr:glycosyltransferase [Gammaproteobacteria bacterium]
MRGRLKELYGAHDLRVINNAVTINTAPGEVTLDVALPIGVRLVYPSVYYPHKNLEVLLDLAGAIQSSQLDYRIVTTVNPDTDAARRYLDSIAERGLQDVITNIGQVPLNQMHSLYKQCDALLMPTLLESFSIVYLEAMHHGLPVFTSDMWFAQAVCGDAAKYFDPFDAKDILRALQEVMPHPSVKRDLTEAGARRLASFPTWEENFATYQKYIDELLVP